MVSILGDLKPVVDETVSRLRAKRFCCDPLMGEHYSRVTSVVSSAYKRHGHIIETAILKALETSDRYRVWNDPALPISRAADALAASYMKNPVGALAAAVPLEEGERTVQVDLLVFDRANGRVRSYEIKRGAGTHDAGKRRSMMRDLLCTQVVLKAYGERMMEQECASAHSHIIVYYGAETLGSPFTLHREQLDDHFEMPIVVMVEEINEYYRSEIERLLEETH